MATVKITRIDRLRFSEDTEKVVVTNEDGRLVATITKGTLPHKTATTLLGGWQTGDEMADLISILFRNVAAYKSGVL